jgi:hypothetical protein
MAEIHVLPKWVSSPYEGNIIDTTSSSGVYRDLSPFVLGPVRSLEGLYSQNFENLWQFSKVYPGQTQPNGNPNTDWYKWRTEGFSDKKAHRYPMGKGKIPLYSWWGEERLGYIDARKKIYAPIYAKYVAETESYRILEGIYQSGISLVLKDYDAYDHLKLGMTLVDVINNPNKKMGHAFVLAMMLTGVLDKCLER